ncbi:MAG: tetratricopeptide repeat protein [Acidobacteriota bacterium]
MLSGHVHRILESAASESLERIRRDQVKAPQRLKPLLAYIEEHLFDPSLDVNQLKRNCGVRDNSVPIQFHSAVGRPPHGYIEDRRLETACKLLAESNLKIWQISELLGYSSIQVFSRAFSRWSGQRPTAYRKKARQRHVSINGDASPLIEESLQARTDKLQRALAGELSLDEANDLIAQLRAMYPDPDSGNDGTNGTEAPVAKPSLEPAAVVPASSSSADLWETKSRIEVILGEGDLDAEQQEEAWRLLEQHNWHEQSSLIRDLRLMSPALFHLLRQRSRLIGRDHPRRGVQVADLALKSLDVIDSSVLDKSELARLKAQAWAWLAHARTLAGDLRGSQQGFATAERFLELAGDDALVRGDIALFQAALRREQCRFDEAWNEVERASQLYGELDRSDLEVTLLIAKAMIAFEEGDPEKSIPFLERATELVDASTDGFLRLALFHNLVTCYAETGRYSQALDLLPQTRQLLGRFGRAGQRIRLRWLEGVILRGRGEFEQAESAMLESREAFTRIDDHPRAALVCLDLANLYQRQSRWEELQKLTASMVPIFGALEQHREAFVALRLFQRACEERALTSVVLNQARRSLQRIPSRSLAAAS